MSLRIEEAEAAWLEPSKPKEIYLVHFLDDAGGSLKFNSKEELEANCHLYEGYCHEVEMKK